MPRRSSLLSGTEVERDFLAALERIAALKPRNPELRARAARGALKLTISAVALEAGRSRRLIAQERGCAYPDIRRRVLELSKKSASAVWEARTDVDALRVEIREMHAELENAKSEILAH